MDKKNKDKDLSQELKKKDLIRKSIFMNIKPPASFISLKSNNYFCGQLAVKNSISTITEGSAQASASGELVYDFSHSNNFDSEAFGKIIDILTQLRAAEDDRSILVQNNTVLREQILNQLKNEVLRVKHKLTKNQIKNLEVISNNNFDKDVLSDILKSLLESSKKKSASEKSQSASKEHSGGTQLVTLEKSSKNYRSVLDKVNYYEKVVDRVLKHVSHKLVKPETKPLERTESTDEAVPPEKTVLKKKSVKDIFDKVSKIQDVKILEEIHKFYEENLVNKMGVLPRVISLQSKISEMNILTKVGTFVENIVQKSVPKFVTSETELINKVISKTNVEELRENLIESQKQYVEDKNFQERNINRLYSEVRKIYNTKTLNKNVTEILKHFDYKKVNLEEHVKKNLLKLTTKKDVINKFKNIYSDAAEDVLVTRTESKTELVNRTLPTTEINEEEKVAIDEIVNLKRSGININKKFIEDIHQNNILMKDINLRQKNIKIIHSNLEKINNVFSEDENIINNFVSRDLITKKHITKNDIENYIEKSKNTELTKIKAKVYKNKVKEITDEVKNEFVKSVTDIHEKEIHNKFKILSYKEKLNILKSSGIEPVVDTLDYKKDNQEFLNKRDIYKFMPIHVKESIFGEDKEEAVLEHDITRFLPDKVFRKRTFKLNTKDIYRNIKKQHIDKYIEKSYNLQKEYLVNKNDDIDKYTEHQHLDQQYMIYKEDVHYPQKGNDVGTDEIKFGQPKKDKGKVKIEKKEPTIPIIDTRKIEKSIMEKTMSKKDIMQLIESYMGGINIDSISQSVIEKVDEKMKFDRQRNGIF